MTHFFYRQKRQLVRESPLLPLIKDVEAKERERKLLLLHDPTHHSLLDSSTQSQIVKLPHELEENYKEIHERRLYKRIFQNYEGQYEENKRWDAISMPPISLYHHHQLNNKRIEDDDYNNNKYDNQLQHYQTKKKKTKNKKQTNNNHNLKQNKSIAFDETLESVQIFVGKPGFEKIALLINAEYNTKKASLLTGKHICCYESLLMFLMRDSSLCYACTRRKKMNFLLCQTCFGIHNNVHDPKILPKPLKHHHTFLETWKWLKKAIVLNIENLEDDNVKNEDIEDV